MDRMSIDCCLLRVSAEIVQGISMEADSANLNFTDVDAVYAVPAVCVSCTVRYKHVLAHWYPVKPVLGVCMSSVPSLE